MCIERRLNGMMVVDRSDTITPKTAIELKQKCVGLLTTRDLLRMIAGSIKDGKSSDEVMNAKVSKQMTPINQVIYGRPAETIGMCRTIMAKLGIKCLPIISEGRVEGILTGRDMSDFFLDAKDRGGKQNYLRDVSDRVGLDTDTSMAEPPVFVRQYLALEHAPVYLNVGVAESPHPFKSADGIGSSRRSELAMYKKCQ
jgi:CBS domain-containing protein